MISCVGRVKMPQWYPREICETLHIFDADYPWPMGVMCESIACKLKAMPAMYNPWSERPFAIVIISP